MTIGLAAHAVEIQRLDHVLRDVFDLAHLESGGGDHARRILVLPREIHVEERAAALEHAKRLGEEPRRVVVQMRGLDVEQRIAARVGQRQCFRIARLETSAYALLRNRCVANPRLRSLMSMPR